MTKLAYPISILAVVALVACRPGAPAATPRREPEATASAEIVSDEAVPTPVPQPDSSSKTGWDDRSLFREGLIGSAQEVLDRLPGASVYHIDLTISDDLLSLQGHQEMRYTNQEDVPLEQVYFQLFPNLAGGATSVSGVQVNGQDVEPLYEFEESAMRVDLPQALQPGEQAIIQMNFDVEIAHETGGNYGLFGYFEGVLVLDKFYPVIPVYDDEGWNVKLLPDKGDLSYFDASFYRVQVTAPAELVLVASGIAVDRQIDGDDQIVTFAAGPARDFYLAASEKYVVISTTVGETTVNSYAFPGWEEGAELALQVTADAIQSFSARLGIYPYTEFDVASTPMQSLGIEYPGMTGITLATYDSDAEVVGLPSQAVLEFVVAHEVGHQWFYNVVGNDQVDEPWVDEALVQYCTWLYYVDTHGQVAAQDYYDTWDYNWSMVEYAKIPIGLPTAAYADNEYSPIVYGRGPIFVETLAGKMGQETFDEFLRDYYQSHRWGIGTGEAFRELAEQHCQCDLSALFEEWVYR